MLDVIKMIVTVFTLGRELIIGSLIVTENIVVV